MDKGLKYFLTGLVKAASTTQTCVMGVNWYDGTHTFISNTFTGNFTDSASVPTLMTSGLITPPGTTASVAVFVQVSNTAGAGEVHNFDILGLIGPIVPPKPQLIVPRLRIPGKKRIFIVRNTLPLIIPMSPRMWG